MLELCLILVLAAHLMAVNVASAGPFVALWLDWRSTRRDDALAADVGRWLARASLVWLTVAIVLGGVLLALLWWSPYEHFWRTAARMPRSRYEFGVAELAFFYVCVAASLALWRPVDGVEKRSPIVVRRLLMLAAGTNLVYHFPTLFAVIGVLGVRPGDATEPIHFRSALVDPEVVAHTLHFLLASFAVTGVAMMGRSLVMRRRRRWDESESQRVAVWGARAALVATVAQLFAGTYLLWQVSPRARDLMMGQDAICTGLFVLSLLGAFALMHRLAAVALGDVGRRELVAAMILMTAVVVLMTATLVRYRRLLADARVAAVSPLPSANVGPYVVGLTARPGEVVRQGHS